MNASSRRTNAHWLFEYRREWLRWDLIAGLITAAVVIPKAMAYATIAGLPVQVGLYTVLIPMTIYAIIGTSRPLSASTTTTLAILAATELGRVVVAGDPNSLMKAAATVTFLVGAILLLASVLRLGFVANFISEPVLIGFKAGIALVIVLDQIPKLLGIHLGKGNFVQKLIGTLEAIPHSSPPTVIVGIVMIVLLVGLRRFFPLAPAPLIVVAIGIVSARLFSLQANGVDMVGQVPAGLPSLTVPDFSLVRQPLAGSFGNCADEFHGNNRCRPRLCQER
jgi:sulfate permease, SulP family